MIISILISLLILKSCRIQNAFGIVDPTVAVFRICLSHINLGNCPAYSISQWLWHPSNGYMGNYGTQGPKFFLSNAHMVNISSFTLIYSQVKISYLFLFISAKLFAFVSRDLKPENILLDTQGNSDAFFF